MRIIMKNAFFLVLTGFYFPRYTGRNRDRKLKKGFILLYGPDEITDGRNCAMQRMAVKRSAKSAAVNNFDAS